MDVESSLRINQSLSGIGGASQDLLAHDGAVLTPLTISAQGSLVTMDASELVGLAPGTVGEWLQSNGADADLSWEASPASQLRTSIPQVLAEEVGRWYVFNRQGLNSGAHATTHSTGSNRIDLWPWIPQVDMTIQQVGVVVTTAQTSSHIKVLIYSSTPGTNLPADLVYESDALDTATTGAKASTAVWEFSAQTLYWVGIVADTASIAISTPANASTPGFLCGYPWVVNKNNSSGFNPTPGVYKASSYATPLTPMTAPTNASPAFPPCGVWYKR